MGNEDDKPIPIGGAFLGLNEKPKDEVQGGALKLALPPQKISNLKNDSK